MYASIDFDTFHGLLVQHIYHLLQQRDEDRIDEKEWVVNEAMNSKNLQHGGTFSNALSRKVDKVIIPIFGEIIASVDHNYNLDLIDPKNEDLTRFWLCMFGNPRIMQFSYDDMVRPREQIPGVGARKAGKDFKSQLPFSWLIFETVRNQWDNAMSTAGILAHFVQFLMI